VNAANLQLDDKQRTIIMQWFMYGGAWGAVWCSVWCCRI
jgi:uncharacterized protein YgiM (DUF1202 family)